MLSKELLSLLRCPNCKGKQLLEHRENFLICHSCRLAYPIVDDIPHMIKEEALPLEGLQAQVKGEKKQ